MARPPSYMPLQGVIPTGLRKNKSVVLRLSLDLPGLTLKTIPDAVS